LTKHNAYEASGSSKGLYNVKNKTGSSLVYIAQSRKQSLKVHNIRPGKGLIAESLHQPLRGQIKQQRALLTSQFDTVWDQYGAIRFRKGAHNKQEEIDVTLRTLKQQERLINQDLSTYLQ